MADSPYQIAVMGATGTGKSTFVKLLTNDARIIIGHSPQSETSDVQTSSYIDQKTGRSVMLIDTPGFDDSRDGVTDTDILEKIVEFLEPKSGTKRKLNGIIYMHRISDPRVGGVSRKNLRMFYSLCGEENLRNVRIVTTNWGRVSEQEGNQREADLRNGAFKALVNAGAQMRRHANTVESARNIMSELVPLQAVTMRIQEEVRSGKALGGTAAGKVIADEMQEMQKNHSRKMVDLKEEMEKVARANDYALRAKEEQERRNVEERIARAKADRERLERRLEQQRREEEARREQERARARQAAALLEQQRREAQAQRERVMAMERRAREEAQRRQYALQQQLAETRRRIAIAQMQDDSDDDCVIC